MPERANVTSVEAIQAFRAQLILYIAKARPALEEVSAEAMRVKVWLESAQRTAWEAEIRRRKRKWDEAQAALFSARISNLRDESSAEIQAVHRAKREYAEAEEKLRAVKRWTREFESRVLPLLKQVEKLQTLFCGDLPRGVVQLEQIIATLQEYAQIGRPPETSGLAASAAAQTAEEAQS